LIVRRTPGQPAAQPPEQASRLVAKTRSDLFDSRLYRGRVRGLSYWKSPTALTAGDPAEVPQLFPDYYRGRLSVSGGRDVTASFGPLVEADARLRSVAAQGPGVVQFATSTGIRKLGLSVVPRPAALEAICEVAADNRLRLRGKSWSLEVRVLDRREHVAASLANPYSSSYLKCPREFQPRGWPSWR
jgi:hypothetical protein